MIILLLFFQRGGCRLQETAGARRLRVEIRLDEEDGASRLLVVVLFGVMVEYSAARLSLLLCFLPHRFIALLEITAIVASASIDEPANDLLSSRPLEGALARWCHQRTRVCPTESRC